MKKSIIIFLPAACLLMILFLTPVSLLAQQTEKCYCPPLKIYIYDTKIDFPLSKTPNAVEAGEYVEVQNSGDWLEGAYLKQQSEEFKVYKGIRPGADSGTTYEPPPANGGISNDEIDFNSYAEISRSGDSGAYVYSVTVNITDAYTGAQVGSLVQTTTDLGKADDLIDANVSTFSPVPDWLRDYQKKVRDQSGSTKWIGLKWKATPVRTLLNKNEKTSIKIKVFDCVDEKPAPNQELHLMLTSERVGTLNVRTITTNASGEATVILTAKKEGMTQVLPNFTYTTVNGVSGWHGLECTDQKNITVTDNSLASHWLFTFNYSESNNQSTKSDGEDISDVMNASANVSMIIDAAPPDKGLVSINTSEGDHILDYSATGNYARKRVRITREMDGSISEKSIRDDNGSPANFRSGLEFTYDPSPGETKGITAAGLNFDLTGTHKYWQKNPDHPGQLKETTDNEDRKNGANIGLGRSDDIVKKIKNGFTIDYNQTKDTTYYNNHGVKNTILHTIQYHAEIIRVNKK